VRSVCFFFLLLCVSATIWAQTNPVPLIDAPLVPSSATPGGQGFKLMVNGAGFVSGSVVHWNGHARTTEFVSKTRLRALIPASDIAKASTASVTVTNPDAANPTSNVAFFSVVTPVVSVAFTGGNFPTFGFPEYVVVGDFNNDGKLDLAVANFTTANSVAILLGNGNGTFQPAVLYPAGEAVGWIAAGDFNGDGKLDLATTNNASNTVSILLRNGDGTFRAPVDYATGTSPLGIVAGDFNGDGKLDLAVVDQGEISIFLGNGDGTFQARTTMNARGFGICTGDFNGDGILDLATADFGQNSGHVVILLGKGDGTFQPGVEYSAGDSPTTVEAADLNGDGIPDLVVGNYSVNGGTVLIGKGDGSFGAPTYLTSLGSSATVADFNGDGKPDIAVADVSADTVAIWLGNGDGTFQLFPNVFQSGQSVQGLAAGDFNNDGAMDLVLAAFGTGHYPGAAFVSLQTNGPAVLFGQAFLTFPTQLVGTQSTISVQMTNVGKAPLDITRIGITGENANSFTQTNNCGTALPAGASCNINLTFAPRDRGLLAASLAVADNAINHQQSIPLSGKGTWVSVTPSSLSFGKQKVGTRSAPRLVQLTNVGGKALNISQIAIGGNGQGDFSQNNTCGLGIGAGASCTIAVTFKPTSRGKHGAFIVIADDGGASPQVITMRGTGT
jgi:FG-GAP-like repeat/Abnormal spindle-like microcephaly-assoc'd, ASPM-SPD-2-Hydin